MNNNDCGCMSGSYTFGENYGNMNNGCGCNKYSGEYGGDNFAYDNCGCDNGNGYGESYGNGYGESYGMSYGSNYDMSYGSNDCGCEKKCHKCAFVRDDNRYEKDECGCGHNYRKQCEEHKECDCGCGSVSFRFCIPPFPFRCK